MRKTILIFSGLSAIMLLLFQLQKWSFFGLGGSGEIPFILTGVVFLLTGILFSRFLSIKSRESQMKIRKSSLSPQENRVLHLMADGLSNKEIGQRLFIEETTVKTHVSNILVKLDARRRTEAIKIGRELKII